MKVVIAGGGTAGHVNPALALAAALDPAEVLFVGTKRGSESKLVPAAGIDLELIEVRGFDRSRPLALFGVGATALRAVRAAKKILHRYSPDVVVGMGGYVALPVCLAARAARIPVVIHEQNIVFGLTNRLCRRVAKRVAVSFEETLARAGPKGVNTGNPVAPGIATMDPDLERKAAVAHFGLDEARKTLLVFGGSQGAKRINEAVSGLVAAWAGKRDRQILHISGSVQTPTEVERKPHDELVYQQVSFVERMQEPYAVADLALCRGGATTVAELGAVGLPALIVPYPYHRDKQQELHGRVLERAGAAKVILDADASAQRISTEADRLLSDETALLSMKEAARAFGRPDAAEALAGVVREVAA